MAATEPTELVLVPALAPVGSETWAAKLRELTKAAFSQAEQSYVQLARLLRVVATTTVGNVPGAAPIYTLWGYSTFQEWAEMDLGIHPHRARALRGIAECVDEGLAALPADTRQGLYDQGFSKLRVLRRVLTLKNASQWLGVAKVTNLATLENMVQTAVAATEKQLPVGGKVPPPITEADLDPDTSADADPFDTPSPAASGPTAYGPPPPQKVVTRRFHLYPNQIAMLDAALQRAQEVTNSDKPGHNLTVLAQMFLAETPFVTPEESREVYFQTLAETLGLRIILTDPTTGEVLLETA